jgi:hypothetical protein
LEIHELFASDFWNVDKKGGYDRRFFLCVYERITRLNAGKMKQTGRKQWWQKQTGGHSSSASSAGRRRRVQSPCPPPLHCAGPHVKVTAADTVQDNLVFCSRVFPTEFTGASSAKKLGFHLEQLPRTTEIISTEGRRVLISLQQLCTFIKVNTTHVQ